MSIGKGLSTLSLPKIFFEESASYYEQYLSNCGYKEKINYWDPTPPNLIKKKETIKKDFMVQPTL